MLMKTDCAEIGAAARRAVAASNLCFRNEQMALGDALESKGTAKPFAEGLRGLLYGGFEAALEDLAHLLKPYNAAKWPILTFWPFFRFPDRHMFLKPTLVQACADRMGYELHYASTPNRDTYDRCSTSQGSSERESRRSSPRTTSTSKASFTSLPPADMCAT
jgi:hypothetical protein